MDTHPHDDHRFEHLRIQHRRRTIPDRPRTRRLAGYTKRSLTTFALSGPESRGTDSAQSAAQSVCTEQDPRAHDQPWPGFAYLFMGRTARASNLFSNVADTCAGGVDGHGDATRAGLGQ